MEEGGEESVEAAGDGLLGFYPANLGDAGGTVMEEYVRQVSVRHDILTP